MTLPHVSSGRLLVNSSGTAAWNMAVDEVLLENASLKGEATLRFYHWTKPSQSLGYFQGVTDRQQHPTSADCDWVRRASGGGAIVHDRSHSDLTYSICVPDFPRRIGEQLELYHLFHESLIELLARVNIRAHLCSSDETTSREAFLCFLRHSEGDVLLGKHKIAGSAQRRHGNAVLQHGSVLLSQSEFAPELPGICQLSTREIELTWLVDGWQQELQRRWPAAWAATELSPSEQVRVREKMGHKYAHASWNHRR